MRRFSANCLDFSYNDKTILDRASLEIPEGSIAGLLGPSGSGKTTFLDIACGLKKISSGNIDSDFSESTYLSQATKAPPSLQMHDIYKMIVALSSNEYITTSQAQERLSHWSPSSASRHKAMQHEKSSSCSYEENRWFFTTSLISASADFVILDEPTDGLRPEFRHGVWECLQGAARDGAAILVASRNVVEVVNNCCYFYMLGQRRFNRFSSGSEFMQRYRAMTLDDAFSRAITEPVF